MLFNARSFPPGRCSCTYPLKPVDIQVHGRCSPSYLYTSSLSIDSSIFIHISLTNPTHLCTPYCCPPSYPAKSKSNFPISLSNPNFLYSPMPAGLASTKHLNPMASALLVPHSINLVPAPLPWCSGCVARRDNSHCGSEMPRRGASKLMSRVCEVLYRGFVRAGWKPNLMSIEILGWYVSPWQVVPNRVCDGLVRCGIYHAQVMNGLIVGIAVVILV